MSDRKIEDLSPEVQEKYAKWADLMKQAGIDYIVTCTRRTQAEQDALYEQGRTTPGHIVTWTHNSKHLLGDAFDFVIMVFGKPDWNMAYKGQWDKAVEFGKECGLTQVIGKDGSVKEFAHLQLG